MGLLEKLKNTFFEEEYVEVEEPEKPKKEKKTLIRKVHEPEEVAEEKPIAKPIPVEKEISFPEKEVYEEETKEVFTEKELTKKEMNFKYFDDDDFVDAEKPVTLKKESVVEEQKIYEGAKLYEGTKLHDTPEYGSAKIHSKNVYSKEAKPGFRPTPIISPIYGVLDQNYKKEDVIDKKEIQKTSSYVSRKNVDLDSVRQKAFGELSHDLGFSSSEVIISKEESEEDFNPLEENLLYDMSDIDSTPKVEKVTIADAEEYFQDLGLEYNIDYKDIKYEKATGRRIRQHPEIDAIEEEDKPMIKDSNLPEEVTVTDENLEDNLFDLIDSMYEEKE